MAKMYFRYGVVSSAKTLNLLATLHNYELQGKKAILIKPAFDTRSTKVESRAGLSHEADIILKDSDFIYSHIELIKDCDAILVDEVQFLTSFQIRELRSISIGKELDKEIPVLCYGLRTKSDATLWPCIVELMALADSIEEIKTTCTYCNHKAIFSKALQNTDEHGINISWEGFVPVCAKHYYSGT